MAETRRYAQGGHVEGAAVPPSAYSAHPDECSYLALDVLAGRLVCGRVGHPTPTSDCHRA